jgi:hypothetical protein
MQDSRSNRLRRLTDANGTTNSGTEKIAYADAANCAAVDRVQPAGPGSRSGQWSCEEDDGETNSFTAVGV